jgi:hypothetical protein
VHDALWLAENDRPFALRRAVPFLAAGGSRSRARIRIIGAGDGAIR